MKNKTENNNLGKIFFSVFLAFSCFALFIFLGNRNTFAAGSATVSWIAPTTDEGGGSLTGLTGYRVYYDTTSHWASACPLNVGNYEDVPSGNAEEYFFNNTLTPGETYYFTVVAYDDSSNISGCAQNSGGATEVSKLITYSGDLDEDHDVDIFDYNILHANYGTSNFIADIDKSGSVGISDYNILKEDYGSSF